MFNEQYKDCPRDLLFLVFFVVILLKQQCEMAMCGEYQLVNHDEIC